MWVRAPLPVLKIKNKYMKLLDIVKDNVVNFDFLRAGIAYYKVCVNNEFYIFSVSLEDVGEASLLSEDKAIIFMRFIRKSIDTNQFHKIIN